MECSCWDVALYTTDLLTTLAHDPPFVCRAPYKEDWQFRGKATIHVFRSTLAPYLPTPMNSIVRLTRGLTRKHLGRTRSMLLHTTSGVSAFPEDDACPLTQFASETGVGTTGRSPTNGITTNSVVILNQSHAVTHNICGLCVTRRRCPVVPLSLRLKRETKLQVFSCVLTLSGQSRIRYSLSPPRFR